jgi:hypothetical protein
METINTDVQVVATDNLGKAAGIYTETRQHPVLNGPWPDGKYIFEFPPTDEFVNAGINWDQGKLRVCPKSYERNRRVLCWAIKTGV